MIWEPPSTTIAALITLASELEAISDSALIDCQAIICHVLTVPRSHLYAHPEALVPGHLVEDIRRLIDRRRHGEPLAYLTGWKEFWSLQLAVTPDVLIPRPETELLVELALAAKSFDHCRVADLGTGSGAIAIAIKKERASWTVTATDRSASALTLAGINARRHAVEIELIEGSWLQPLARRQFNLIISNPPYIGSGDPDDETSGFEPRSALIAGDNGLADLSTIIGAAPGHLAPGGLLLLEHGYGQRNAVCAMLEAHGFADIRSFKDLGGHDRAVCARKVGE